MEIELGRRKEEVTLTEEEEKRIKKNTIDRHL